MRDIKEMLSFLYSPDSYGTSKYKEYYEWNTKDWSYQKTARNASLLGFGAFVISIILMFVFKVSLIFFWIPPLVYFLTAMVAETFSMKVIAPFANKAYQKLLKAREERQKLEEQLKSIPPEKLNYEYAITLIEKWEELQIPDFMSAEFKAICKDLRELVRVTKENGINIDKWTQLFRNYMPDIVDVIDDFESDDGVNDTEMLELCSALHGYLVSEIEDVKNGKRISNFATVKAYTELFKGNVNTFKNASEKEDEQGGTPLGGV